MTFRRTALAGAALAVAGGCLTGLQPATAVLAWAPAATAQIHPGVRTLTSGAQCTANFVFQDSAGAVYIGQAAHCSSTGGSTSTNGCTTGSRPLNTPVTVVGATVVGRMVYNSWLTMQGIPETDSNTCAYNDFALIKLDPNDYGRVNPSVPFWGGPRALRTTGLSTGATVVSYGNSSLRFGISALSPKQGVSIGDTGGGWSHGMYTATPGIPGDSGSGFMDANGDAFGVLSTIAIAPFPASNNAGDLNKELAYMRAHSAFTTVNLVPGTEPFTGPLP
jgi:hypothetical protein